MVLQKFYFINGHHLGETCYQDAKVITSQPQAPDVWILPPPPFWFFFSRDNFLKICEFPVYPIHISIYSEGAGQFKRVCKDEFEY
jgi:hypothetical protein